MALLDRLGNELQIGDRVAYAVVRYKSGVLRTGHITGMTEGYNNNVFLNVTSEIQQGMTRKGSTSKLAENFIFLSRPEVEDKRPAECRSRLKDEGKPYGRSGCRVGGCKGAFGPCIATSKI